MGKLVLCQAQDGAKYEQRARCIREGAGQVVLSNMCKAGGGCVSGVIRCLEVFAFVKWCFMDVREIRRKMLQVESPSN